MPEGLNKWSTKWFKCILSANGLSSSLHLAVPNGGPQLIWFRVLQSASWVLACNLVVPTTTSGLPQKSKSCPNPGTEVLQACSSCRLHSFISTSSQIRVSVLVCFNLVYIFIGWVWWTTPHDLEWSRILICSLSPKESSDWIKSKQESKGRKGSGDGRFFALPSWHPMSKRSDPGCLPPAASFPCCSWCWIILISTTFFPRR